VPDGRYRVWVGGFATNEATGKVTTTQWSSVYQFDIGGRPSLNVPVSTTDTTPSINWSVVEGAASYEVYLAAAEAIGTPIVRETGVSGNSFTFNQLSIGDYRVWVRGRAIDGRTTQWSLSSQSFMSVSLTQALVAPVLGNVTLNGRTPTFTWGAVASAARYEIYVAPLTTTGTPTVRVDNITSTTYTANAGIPVDNYRVWVRAISLTGALGPWSAPTSFAVASTDVQGVSGQPETMLTRISMTDVAALVQEQVTVSQTPVTVVDRSEGPADPQTIFVVRQAKTVAQVSDSVAQTT
jgi:large repetitive protein